MAANETKKAEEIKPAAAVEKKVEQAPQPVD